MQKQQNYTQSFCQENKFLVCVNIPGNKANSDSDFYKGKNKHNMTPLITNIHYINYAQDGKHFITSSVGAGEVSKWNKL